MEWPRHLQERQTRDVSLIGPRRHAGGREPRLRIGDAGDLRQSRCEGGETVEFIGSYRDVFTAGITEYGKQIPRSQRDDRDCEIRLLA
jgi:hypothetical protein